MKIIHVVPKPGLKLKSELKQKERTLRGKGTTFYRESEGKWKHEVYAGWINWDEGYGGSIVAEIKSRKKEAEWQILHAFIGYLERHFSDDIESISINFR